MTRRGIAAAAGTFGAWTLVTAWLTWPLAAHLGTHLPHTSFICDFDLRQMIWALSWQSHALTTNFWRFYDANIYHPTQHALLYADAGFGALPYFLPTFLATGNPVLASNVMFLGSIVLTATLLHRLVARWTGLGSAGLVAAGAFVTTRWILWTWVPAAPNYAVLHTLPIIVALAADPTGSGRRLRFLGVALVLHGMITPYYAASSLAPIALLATGRLLVPRTRSTGCGLAVTIAIATLALACVYAPYAWIRAAEPDLRYQTWWGFVRDTTMVLPDGLFFRPLLPTSVPLPFLLLVPLGLLSRMIPLPGRTRDEAVAWRHGGLWAATGLLLSLTPTVRIMDHVVRLPQANLIDRYPGLDLLRDPHRMGVAALVGLAILAGVAFAELHRRLEQLLHAPDARALRALSASLLVVVASGVVWTPTSLRVAGWPSPYPITAGVAPESPVTARVRESNGPLLQLPVDPGASLEAQLGAQALAMFESIGHWRPLLNGYGGFFPQAFVERMRLAARLPDATALAELRRDTGVVQILVRRDLTTGVMRERWDTLARSGGGEGLRLVARDETSLLFDVE